MTEVDETVYKESKQLYTQRFELPDDHPDKMKSMEDWLSYYNILDVQPMVVAVENCFTAFRKYFFIDPMVHNSLPGMAYKAMFQMHDQNLPYAYTFADEDAHNDFKKNVIGGCVNVYHRDICLNDDDAPKNAKISPSGDPYTYALFLDFNAMYSWSMGQDMPLTAGML